MWWYDGKERIVHYWLQILRGVRIKPLRVFKLSPRSSPTEAKCVPNADVF